MYISLKESRIENNRSFYGCFYLGTFDSSQSLTVANALRRSLLADCTGLAIISVKIDNVYHEYSTLPGVRDSVLDILLNLKEIVFKKTKNPLKGTYGYKNKGISYIYDKIGSTFFKPVVGYLKVKGPGVIRAKDLRLPPFIQIVDPNQYIATLAEDGVLNMEFVIMEGKSFYIHKRSDFSNVSSETSSEFNTANEQDEDTTRESQLPLNVESPYYNIIEKRRNLLKQLKEIVDLSVQETQPKLENINSSSFQNLNLARPTLKVKNSQKALSNSIKLKNKESIKGLRAGSRGLLVQDNSKQLYIDAIFSPVTKVNYIIEQTDNYIVDYFNRKVNVIEKLTRLLDSNEFLKTNFPYLGEVTLPTNSFNLDEQDQTDGVNNFNLAKRILDYITNQSKNVNDNPHNSSQIRSTSSQNLDLLCTPQGYSHFKGIGLPSSSKISNTSLQSKKSTEESENSLRHLTEIKTQQDQIDNKEFYLNSGSQNVIILEIWTNGSIHPRDALLTSFKNLSSFFNVRNGDSPQRINTGDSRSSSLKISSATHPVINM